MQRCCLLSFFSATLLLGCSAPSTLTEQPIAKDSSAKSVDWDTKLKGWELAYVDADSNVCVSRGDGSDVKVIAKSATLPTWTPDGRFLAYYQGSQILLRNMIDGKVRTLCRIPKLEAEQLTFDPVFQLLLVPVGEEIKFFNLGGDAMGSYSGKWRSGTINAVNWSPSGQLLAFSSHGDVWLGIRQGSYKEIESSGFIPNISPGSASYVEAVRLAAVASFNDTEGNSASTPLWADGFTWLSDERTLMFHYQRQHGSGVSQVGFLHLTPREHDSASIEEIHETQSGYKVDLRWYESKEDVFDPSICPDGKTISIESGPYENGFRLMLIDSNGKVLKQLQSNRSQATWRPKPDGKKPYNQRAKASKDFLN